MTIVKNAWYVACAGKDLQERPLGRNICNEPMALFRTESGQAHALRDLCPHRKAPLSMGRVSGETLRCIYHGLAFNGAGQCTHIPSQDAIPPRACVRSFPVREQYGLIWVWPGDPALADSGLLPERPWLEDEAWDRDVVQYFNVKAAYTLMGDNLLDLSHVAFLHHPSIGFNPKLLEKDPLQTRVDEGAVSNERIFVGTTQAPAHKAWHEFPGEITRVQQSRWTPPGNVTVLVRNEDASKQVDLRADHFITPETEGTHHYFVVISRNFRIGDAALSAQLDRDTRAVHMEDVEIAEAQQRMRGLFPDVPEMGLMADKGVRAAKRILDELIAKEQPRIPVSA